MRSRGSSADGSSSSTLMGLDDASAPVLVISNDSRSSGNGAANLCKGGQSVATFNGSYESSYPIGIPLTVDRQRLT